MAAQLASDNQYSTGGPSSSTNPDAERAMLPQNAPFIQDGASEGSPYSTYPHSREHWDPYVERMRWLGWEIGFAIAEWINAGRGMPPC